MDDVPQAPDAPGEEGTRDHQSLVDVWGLAVYGLGDRAVCGAECLCWDPKGELLGPCAG